MTVDKNSIRVLVDFFGTFYKSKLLHLCVWTPIEQKKDDEIKRKRKILIPTLRLRVITEQQLFYVPVKDAARQRASTFKVELILMLHNISIRG